MLDPPDAVQRIAARLEHAGFETWCVGGAVRDALLGRPHLDWDLATAATPQQVRKLFRRTVPVGIEFGTVGVLDEHGIMHEVTTFRRDVQTDGRHAVVEFGASLDEDLARRDFTINAIAFSPSSGRLHDPFAGQDDLARGLIRAVGDPVARLREDRLRALRAIRFAARFGFQIERNTWDAIVAAAPSLGRLSPERVKQELEKTMEQVERPSTALLLWQSSGALAALVPELAGVSRLTLETIDALPQPSLAGRPQRKINRLTALFAELSPTDVAAALRELRFSKSDITWIAAVAELWQQMAPEMERVLLGLGPPSNRQVRRWVASAGRTRIATVLRLAHARWTAQRRTGLDAPSRAAVASLYRRALRSAFRDPVELSDLAVDGDDLRAAGFAAGPMLGGILHALLDAVVDDPSLNTPERLLERAAVLRDGFSGPLPPER